MIREHLRGRAILLTGGTGFVGKVLLEKLLRCTDPGCIFLLIRGSKSKSAQERFKSEIMDSKCFDRLRSERQDFDELVERKVVVISGDLLAEGLGLCDMDRQRLVDEVNIVIHCAASVEFNNPLYTALQLITVGTVRIFDLAKECRRLESFVHVSTAYSNCDRSGVVEEKIYPHSFDALELVNSLLSKSEAEVNALHATVVSANNYPNTYTFVKYLTEVLLLSKRGTMPMAIFRPSIIGGSWAEPMPGWVDTISAAGALYLPIGLGMLRIVQAHGDKVGDQVPVDFVCNAILACAVAVMNQDRYEIFHFGTSNRNPIVWGYAAISVLRYWQEHTPSRSIGPSGLVRAENSTLFNTMFWLRYKMPTALFTAYTRAAGTPPQKKMASQLQKLTSKMEMANTFFGYFMTHEWVFEDSHTLALWDKLCATNPEEAEMFPFDVRQIQWDRYTMNFCYGLQKYVLKDTNIDYTPSTDTAICLLTQRLDDGFFSDMKWAWYSSPTPFPIPRTVVGAPVAMKAVLSDPRVEAAVALEATQRNISVSAARALAAGMLKGITADLRMGMIRMVGWFLRKVWRQIFEGLAVDQVALGRVRDATERGTVIYLPTHRSYIDFLMLSYLCLHYNLPVPHIAAGQDFAHIPLITPILQRCGAFFLKRAFQPDSLYGVVFSTYTQYLVNAGSPLEFFIEGTRSRTGKMLHPKVGLLHWVVEPLLTGVSDRDIYLVPININYEKVLETTLFPDEMLGAPKKKESLRGLVKARTVLTQSFGRVDIRFGKPISVKERTAHFLSKSESPIDLKTSVPQRIEFCKWLGYQIVYDLHRGQACHATSILAAILLTIGQNGVFKEQLPKLVEWLRSELMLRGAHIPQIGTDDGTVREAIEIATRLLPEQICEAANLVYPAIAVSLRDPTPTVDMHKNGLVLAYYRNQLVHVFVSEAIVAMAFSSFADAHTVGIPRLALLEEALFVYDLLSVEFVVDVRPSPREHFQRIIDLMLARGILRPADAAAPASNSDLEEMRMHDRDDNMLLRGDGGNETARRMTFFLNSLLAPFMEAYVVAFRSLTALLPAAKNASPITLPESALVSALRRAADAAFKTGETTLYESCSVAIIRNAIATMQRWGVLGGRSQMQLMAPYDQPEKLKQLISRISRYRQTSHHVPVTPAPPPFHIAPSDVTEAAAGKPMKPTARL